MKTDPSPQVVAAHPARPEPRLTAAHWGVYEAVGEGDAMHLKGFVGDPSPSPIGLSMLDAARGPVRVRRPVARQSWLAARRAGQPQVHGERRGDEPFVEVSWEEALDLVAHAIEEVRSEHGNESIFGGSYGWSSAGRFHHAQSQVHRFLNSVGGYVRHADSYSLGAARVLLPHIVAPIDELFVKHTSWRVMARHTQLFVTFGGVPAKNAQVSSGGATAHVVDQGLRDMASAGVRFINVSPVSDNLDTGGPVEWLPIRPHADTALILALCHTLLTAELHDRTFLSTHCVGFNKVEAYLLGHTDGQPKDATWAAALTELPVGRIIALTHDMAAARTMLNISWSLQRSHHGEQPFWALITLAAMLGQIGLAGGGFGVGYGTTNMIGNDNLRIPGPTLPQGRNAVGAFIPVARIADMLERPGEAFDYNGARHRYPDIHLIYWAGGNPFHHHQDLNRLHRAWQTKPRTIIVHEQYWTPTAKLADVVLPATTSLEREDIGYASRERFMIAMKPLLAPVDGARDDYAIFCDLSARLGAFDAFTEGRDAHGWLQWMYAESRNKCREAGVNLPDFGTFWRQGTIDLAEPEAEVVMFADFRTDPLAHPLNTPSGKLELFSERIASFGYADCPGQATWMEPVEWLGNAASDRHTLHLLSDQPHTKLHSQLDHAAYSQANKVGGREPVTLSPQDAAARGLTDGDVVRIFNARGSCLAAVRISDALRTGVARLSTGAWYDPASWRAGAIGPDKHGNPNVLTLDMGASSLSQGCIAQTCLVQIERYDGPPLAPTPYQLPEIVADLEPAA
ncbi:molybdopterin-dependent oxidoreductase [Ottowia sp. GY511]|uniref:Molybdopterin-dependent oxidoreductase n=1 Tax=Ottowia flava TaxID=2675430 RepID=A0ABW4KUE5_9BURK|nr:molybdopterin-dependent oxidoreductase [Ottowia sp. GY511]TXK33347.1 molybdopterin-dependent oxidoreductase [Ottowia sp. GY511]